jgi:hypothetical protein
MIGNGLKGGSGPSEQILEWRVSEDTEKLVLVGKEYFYVFDMPEKLAAMASTSYRSELRVNSYLGISISLNEEDVMAEIDPYDLGLDIDSAVIEAVKAAVADGFKPVYGRLACCAVAMPLKGKRSRNIDFATVSPGWKLEPLARRVGIYQQKTPEQVAREYTWLKIRFGLAVVADLIIAWVFIF